MHLMMTQGEIIGKKHKDFRVVSFLALLAAPIITVVIMTGWSLAWAKDDSKSLLPDKTAEKVKASTNEIDSRQLKAKRSAAEASQDLGDSLKKTVLGLLDQAIRFRELVDQYNQGISENAQKIKLAPVRLKEIQGQLDRPIPTPDSVAKIASTLETDKLEQKIRSEEAGLVTAKTTLSDLANQFDKEKNRPLELREAIAKAKGRLEKIREELKTDVPAEEPSLLTEARRLALLAEQAKNQAEIKFYEQELVGHEVLVSLLTVERDLALRETAWRESLTEAWQVEAQKRRHLEAEKAKLEAEEAKEKALTLPVEVQKQFDVNVKLGEDLAKLTLSETELEKRLQLKQGLLKELEDEFSLARQRVETTVLTEAIGLALREQRKLLPDLRTYRRDSAQRQLKMTEIHEAQLAIDALRRALADIDVETDRLIRGINHLSDTELDLLRKKVRLLLVDRRELLNKLETSYRRYFKNLENLEFNEQQLVTRADEFAEFLDVHLLWIRSSKILGPSNLRNLPAAVGWLSSLDNWKRVRQDMAKAFGRSPEWWVLGLLIEVMLLAFRRRARQSLELIAEGLDREEQESFGSTLRALGATVYLAAGWPIIPGFIGWQLQNLPLAYDFTRAAGKGLIDAAALLVFFGFFFHVCRKNGLAQVHFRWPEKIRLSLKHNLLWFTFLAVFLGFVTSAVETGDIAAYRNSLGRLALMATMLGYSAFVARVLRFSNWMHTRPAENPSQGLIVRLRYIWYPVAIGIPMLVAGLAVIGYQYTAFTLWYPLHTTLWFAAGLLVIYDLLLRWLVITKNRLVWKEYRQEGQPAPEAVVSRRQVGVEVSAARSSLEHGSIEKSELDLVQIDEQTRSLLRALLLFSALLGLWIIWKAVLPALNVIGEIQIWGYRAVVEGVAQTMPITLANLALAILALAVTIVAARNLPGVLEITLLNHLAMDSGTRYAFTTLSRYTIAMVGFLVAFNTIGVRWSSLQWLIAALGVGLGFGLQEIVANFISGLIVLFERPYRVGDLVTVGDLSGTVTRIRIRATTITDLDRRELIVPNKEFITGKLINWSLSDPIIRVVLPVGVAYGSDTALVEKLLVKAARENELVLDDPEPSALFVGFGNSSLNFELRVFIKEAQERFITMHQLNLEIDHAFREADIVIPFPQRDLNLDPTQPLNVHIVTEERSSDKPDGSHISKS
jgi:potassium efflux system protein